MSKKHGASKKRRKRNPPLPAGWAKPRKAVLALLAEQGVTEADWRRIQKARVLIYEVNDAVAARGGQVHYCVLQTVAREKPEWPAGLPADDY